MRSIVAHGLVVASAIWVASAGLGAEPTRIDEPTKAVGAGFYERLAFELSPELGIPLEMDRYGLGLGAGLCARVEAFGGLGAYLATAYSLVSTPSGDGLTLLRGGGGLYFEAYPLDRLGLSVGAGGGVYTATFKGESRWSWFLSGDVSAAFRLSPALSLRLGPCLSLYLAPSAPLVTSLGASLGIQVALSGLSSGSVRIESARLDPVFPVFYSRYDDQSFGELMIRNGEDGAIRDISVFFFAKQYMNEPRICAKIAMIPKEGTATVPVLALFSENVLRLTEDSKVSAEIRVEYSFLGSRRSLSLSVPVHLRHRNAMCWDDDRKAAAFASAKDPAVLRYSKFVAGLVREVDELPEINSSLKFAIGLFEGLRLYGLNYVVDPTTPYESLSADAMAVDFLQFPYQTLVYKGGDCDDLSIMFASALQSVGIEAAFVTVPGHIYVAFALEGPTEEAARGFAQADELISHGGKAWVPLEITLVHAGFLRAWQYGAREWRDNQSERVLLPLAEAWEAYPAVGIPGEDTRIALPPAEDLKAVYLGSIKAFALKESDAQASRVKKELEAKPGDARLRNALGIVYARFGRLAEARSEFEKAAKAGARTAIANLGNVAFLQKDYKAALSYFERALEARPDNPVALLGAARAAYELNRSLEAAGYSGRLAAAAPELAATYAYLSDASRGDRASAALVAGSLWDEE